MTAPVSPVGTVLLLGLGITGLCLLAWALLRRRLMVATVYGESMAPTYHHGDRVLVLRSGSPARGRVVVVAVPNPIDGRRWMIKRVAAVPGDPVPRLGPALTGAPEARVPPDHLVLLGDNHRDSFDSRQAGYFPAHQVLGAVLPARVRSSPFESRVVSKSD